MNLYPLLKYSSHPLTLDTSQSKVINNSRACNIVDDMKYNSFLWISAYKLVFISLYILVVVVPARCTVYCSFPLN